jgi:hypothetical protein
MKKEQVINTPIRWLYTKEQDVVSIQISPLVLIQLPFNILEDGYKQMKAKQESKIITVDN